MAITNTRQAKQFTAGAPNIMLKGDLRPLNTMAYGGRAQYGLGSFVKKVVKKATTLPRKLIKETKRFAKSDLGKAALTAAALYFAPAAFGGTTGFGAGSTYGNFFRTIGQGSKFAGTGLGGGFDRLAFNAARTSGGNTGILSSIGKAVGDIGLSKKGKGTLASFAIGSLGSAALSAAEAGGLEYQDPNAEVDLESLQGYLSRGYKNLNPKATDDEVFQFVQENTAEYRADGGRMGYDDGGITFGDFLKMRQKEDKQRSKDMLFKDYEEFKRRQKVQEQKTMAAEGGRIGYAMGDTASENAMQAAGIEGLPVRQNKAGVTELDLRETGGFVPPVGIKEKADDIPAMLSNNEFVFTADAVRAAGGGNINKGAQLMYDTMKQLESRVS